MANDYISSVLDHWIKFVQRFPLYIVIFSIGITAIALNYTVDNLGMNTDTRDMLSSDLPWRQQDLEYEKKFPQYNDNILLVVEASTRDQAQDAANAIYDELNIHKNLFKSLFYPQALPFFNKSAFLYLDTNELQDLSDNLAAIQPFLYKLTTDQSIRGLFSMLEDAIIAQHDGEEIDLVPLINELALVFDTLNQKDNYQFSWHALLSGQKNKKDNYQEFIVLQPVQDYTTFLPTQNAIEKIHSLIDELNLSEKYKSRIRITGSAALAHEELLSVSQGTGKAIVLALILVAIIMLTGLGSVWLVIATLFTLLTGLILTAAFATITVGELNLISVAFAVLYIGLGVDFAIHLCLRYRELLKLNNHRQSALKEATTNVGGSLVLCALTTAIGFYAFIPTDYDGVAELGWISGSGMFISLLVTLTVLPALLCLLPHSISSDKKREFRLLNKLFDFPLHRSQSIKIILILVIVSSLFLIKKARFDYNTLNLQSPENESVQTYLDLLKESDTSPWTSVLLVNNREQAEKVKTKIKQLSLVSKILWLDDFIPENQQEKLAIIDEMYLLLGDFSVSEKNKPINTQDRMDALINLNNILENYDDLQPEETRLKYHLDKIIKQLQNMSAKEKEEILYKVDQNVMASLPGRLDALSKALGAELVSSNGIPDVISSRWKSEDGTYLLEIFPVKNLMNNKDMENFVRQLQKDFPQVIGSPVINIEAGHAVITAFQQAFLYALITITFLLLILLRNIRDTVYILIPLIIAALLTGSFSVLLHIPFNFANIIALPLLLGIGVDSAIHIIHRSRSAPPKDGRLLATSSARAVLVSGLTTIFSIGNLAFSPHLGTASMGKLLTIGICMTLICTLIILPSLLKENNSKTSALDKDSKKPWDARLAYQLIYPLKNSFVTPNHLTTLRLGFGILAAIGFSLGSYFWINIGAWCFVISNFLDHTDGELARLTGKMSKQGHYFDLASDAIVNIVLFIGIGIGLMNSSLGWWTIPMGMMAGISVAGIFHMRNEIEKQIGKPGARQPNFAGFEAEDILYLLPLVSVTDSLVPFLILASVGAPLFTIFVWREFNSTCILKH